MQSFAANTYKTAGMSANRYMETTRGFSASLIQSLGGDTKKATKIAGMAITDMSDNANKMGTDVASIQNAYHGFAKQNYAKLDNLTLGYGGTKTEMERLLADAEKFSGNKYNIILLYRCRIGYSCHPRRGGHHGHYHAGSDKPYRLYVGYAVGYRPSYGGAGRRERRCRNTDRECGRNVSECPDNIVPVIENITIEGNIVAVSIENTFGYRGQLLNIFTPKMRGTFVYRNRQIECINEGLTSLFPMGCDYSITMGIYSYFYIFNVDIPVFALPDYAVGYFDFFSAPLNNIAGAQS